MNIQHSTPTTPLRAHMIADMSVRNLGPASQTSHLRACRRQAVWLGRSPETATPNDVKYFQQHLVESGASIGTLVCPFAPDMSTPLAFSHYLISPMGQAAGPKVIAFREWLISELETTDTV